MNFIDLKGSCAGGYFTTPTASSLIIESKRAVGDREAGIHLQQSNEPQ